MRISDWSSDVCSSDLDPQQVLRVLIFQGPPRFDPGVNEEVVARFVEQLQFPQEGEVRGRDRCAQPLAGTVGGKRGLSMALQQDAIASGRGPAAESEPSLAAAFAVEEAQQGVRSEEHTSELQSLMRISYAVFCLQKKKTNSRDIITTI